MLINYRARATQIGRMLEAAGWRRSAVTWRGKTEDDWYPPPGRGPTGPWSLASAWKYHAMGELFRALAARGWDVPPEYVGHEGACTIGQYPKHPDKSGGRFITLGAALRKEGMRSLRSSMVLPLMDREQDREQSKP